MHSFTTKFMLISAFLLMLTAVILVLPLSSQSSVTNLAIIPDNWSLTGYYPEQGSPPQTTPYIFLDTDVLHNGDVFIRIDPCVTTDRATWMNYAVNVSPGDHVVAICWVKTGASSSGEGARIGVDLCDAQGIIAGVSQDDYGFLPAFPEGYGAFLNYVPFGSGWQQRTIDFVVPYLISINENGVQINPARIPTKIIMWMQVKDHDSSASAWFSDAELYVNPPVSTQYTSITISLLVGAALVVIYVIASRIRR